MATIRPGNSYKTNQFFNTRDKSGIVGPRGLDVRSQGSDNPRFVWPGRFRKELNKDGRMDDVVVDRGFMRLLPISKSGAAKDYSPRCFFQFNPQTVTRSLSMRQDVTHPFLQDPAQLTMPVPGNMNFAFDLFFDRTHDINSADLVTQAAGLFNESNFDPFDANLPPEQFGIMSDLVMFDQIVGQGLSGKLKDFILERQRIAYSYSVQNSASEGTSEDTEDTENFDVVQWSDEQATSFLDANVGNQAFLFPNPVRVVFSSLFMLDGFITSTAVTFAQFNRAMVPVRCGINVTMQALYFGFAREDTFLTANLALAEERIVPVVTPSTPVGSTPNTSEEREVKSEVLNKLSNIFVSIGGFGGRGTQEPPTLEDVTSSFSREYTRNVVDTYRPNLKQVVGRDGPELQCRLDFTDWSVLEDSFSSSANNLKSVRIEVQIDISRKGVGGADGGTGDKTLLKTEFSFTMQSSADVEAAKILDKDPGSLLDSKGRAYRTVNSAHVGGELGEYFLFRGGRDEYLRWYNEQWTRNRNLVRGTITIKVTATPSSGSAQYVTYRQSKAMNPHFMPYFIATKAAEAPRLVTRAEREGPNA